MFKITIEGETLEDLGTSLATMAAQFGTTVAAPTTKPKATKAKAAPQPEPEETDAELERELNAPVEPMPETAKAVVDAGTGQTASPTAIVADEEPTVELTMADVRAKAGKLAATDTKKLAELLNKYGAAKLSEVSAENLPLFAADVLEALG